MTNIQWTDVTDNIITVEGGGWWCRREGPDCDNCYAAAINQNSFFGGNGLDYSGKPPQLVLKRDILKSWARQTKPKKHFVSSMTDIFGEWTYFNWHHEILDAMWNAPKQTFQILTKRPRIMRDACLQWMKNWGLPRMPDNIWVGTSAGNQAMADRRIPALLEIPARVRFVSCEPLIGSIDLEEYVNGSPAYWFADGDPPIDWVIIGGESGNGARPCKIEWIESIVKQCKSAKVPVFLKQLGSFPVGHDPQFENTEVIDRKNYSRWYFEEAQKQGIDSLERMFHIKTCDKKGGDIKEFPKYLQIREFPADA